MSRKGWRPCRLVSSEVRGTLAKLSPIKGLRGLPETLRAAQVMSPSKGGPSEPSFEVKGDARRRQVPAGMARDLFAGLQLAIRPSSDTFQEINSFSSGKALGREIRGRAVNRAPLLHPQPLCLPFGNRLCPHPCSPNAPLHL